MTRRQFVQTAGIFSALSYNRIVGANKRVGLGFIGMGGRGMGLLKDCFLNNKSVEPLAVCDVYAPNTEKAVHTIRTKTGRLITHQFVDFRHLLDLKEVEAVAIATPDHWHALMTIMACEAGKDVYLEKPTSLFIDEEEFMLKAAHEHDRVVQVGTQQRSSGLFQSAVRLVQSDALGKINYIECWIYWVPELTNEPKEKPADFNWDLWLGPAPYAPYDPARAFWTFRYFWDYSGGKLTDWGAHHFDVILWAMDKIGPLKVTAVGGIRHMKDHRETPDDLVVTYDFEDFTCVFKHAPERFQGNKKRNHGIEFVGDRGILTLDRKGYEVAEKAGFPTDAPHKAKSGQFPKETPAHVADFVRCVKTRKKPISTLEEHGSSLMAHLGNIAYLSQQTVFWDPETNALAPATLHKYLSREYRQPWKLNNRN